MFDIAYWRSEVAAFKEFCASHDASDSSKLRWILRGLAVLATEVIRDHPEDTTEVQTDFHEALRSVRDRGVVLAVEGWLREHASPDVAAAAEHFLGHDLGSAPPADADEEWPMDDINEANRIGDALGGLIREEFAKKQKLN